MSGDFYLGRGLLIDPEKVVLGLENFTLYRDFFERIEDALRLIERGQVLWGEHKKNGEWLFEAVDAASSVRRLADNIRWCFDRSGNDLAGCIRQIAGLDEKFTNCQCVAALAIARACLTIEVLARYLSDFEIELDRAAPYSWAVLARDEPGVATERLEEIRQQFVLNEMAVRERVADSFGEAKYYITLAAVYASPRLSRAEKIRISTCASKAGLSSAAVRQEAVADRDQSICAHGRRLLADGRARREIAGVILGTDSALKTHGGSDKLSRTQIKNILIKNGVLPPSKEKMKMNER
ncbi:hypothetical protein FQ192_13030 [Pseudomonas sp. ANT_J12]|uniref:hypothetical protein n=1 Tax=Pseudomonas sp. ANT_J12 TaxID=2597351 RepID=UPI0011F13487|nr:hypothetical protein [Pseudomonas sp. ANT_J12]KAA0994258.1 hypothetical protein FQ192_13030 [Pseudomonas sp. ANT_J12]